MITELPPAFLFLAAALIAPLLPSGVRKPLLLATPLLALAVVFGLPEGVHFNYSLFNLDLALIQVDRLNRVITSYSIHYTKLYETDGAAKSLPGSAMEQKIAAVLEGEP